MSFRIRNTSLEKERDDAAKDSNSIEPNLSQIRQEVDKEFKEQEPIKKSLLYNYKSGKWVVIKQKKK